MTIDGICPVLVTPMTETGAPDEAGIDRLVRFLVDAGVGGLWVLGSAGEDIHIGRDDRIRVVEAVCAAVERRIPVIAGTGLVNVNEILAFVDRIAGFGVDGVHAIYFDQKQSEARMIAEMTRLAERSPLPVWLYHNPFRGRSVTPRVIRELRDHPNIDGMKVAGYVLTDMINAVMLQTPTFTVMGAGGGQFFTMLTLGCTAHTASDACCWPEEFVRLYRLFRSGDVEGAREQQFRLIALNQTVPKGAKAENGETSAEDKYILSLRGICDEHVNPAYRRLTAEEKAATERALRDFGFAWMKGR